MNKARDFIRRIHETQKNNWELGPSLSELAECLEDIVTRLERLEASSVHAMTHDENGTIYCPRDECVRQANSIRQEAGLAPLHPV